MKQMSLGESGFERKTKRTRKREFLDEMNLVVPWAELVSLIAPHAPAPGAKGGRPPFAVETMLRIHFLQQWFNLSDPAMEEALYDMALFREFVGLDAGEDNLPDESTILRFRHLLEAHNLSSQILGVVFGGWAWLRSLTTGQPATSGTVMLAALPLIIGIQFLIAFLHHDVERVPSQPLSEDLTDDPEETSAARAG